MQNFKMVDSAIAALVSSHAKLITHGDMCYNGINLKVTIVREKAKPSPL